MSSDTSGDEDNLELLREAADHQFINDSMFRRDGREEKGEKKPPPSQRSSKPEDQFNALGVTPEFQAHVAKRLAANLEQQLRYSFATDDDANRTGRGTKGGIKLFKDSAHFIESDVDGAASFKKRRPLADDDPSEERKEEAKIKAASVTPESILNKMDVAFWSGRSKAPLFKYRRTKGGHLVSADDEI